MSGLDQKLLLAPGAYASIPAAGAVTKGALYPATDRGIIYRSDLLTWTPWGVYDVAAYNAYMGYVTLAEASAPGTPASGYARLYVKPNGLLYWKDDAGIEYNVATGTPMTDPLTTNGDLVARIGGVTTRLAIGATGKFLRVVAGLPAWDSLVAADMPAEVPQLLAKGYSPTTVTNTTEATIVPGSLVGSLTLPANFFTAGKSILIRAGGYWKVYDTTHTFRHRIKMTDSTPTTVIVADTTALNPSYVTAGAALLVWEATYLLTCITAGASGTFRGVGSVIFHDPGAMGGIFPVSMPLSNPAGVSTAIVLDTTKTQLISWTHQSSANHANTTLTQTNFVVEGL